MADKLDMRPLIEHALTVAGDAVLAGNEFPRTFFAVDRNAELNIIVAPALSDEGERGVVAYLRILFAALGVTEYAMLSEVWVSTRDEYSRGNGLMPKDDPEREEAIIASGVRRVLGESGNHVDCPVVARRTITRDPTTVGDIEWPQMDSVSGRFATLLPPPGIPTPPKEVLQQLLDVIEKAGVVQRMVQKDWQPAN